MKKIIFILGILLISLISVDKSSADNYDCNSDSDCVKEQCCHPTSSINKLYAPNCQGVMCTMECKPNTLDCGQGEIKCINNKCETTLGEIIPPPPPPPPTGWEALWNKIKLFILDLFKRIGLTSQIIVGKEVVKAGTTHTYDFDLSTTVPDSDYTDGTYQIQYGNWALVDKNQNVIEEGTWEEVDGKYKKQVTIKVPEDIGNYVLIGVISQFDMVYDSSIKEWVTGEEEILIKEGIDLRTEAPLPDKPTPRGFVQLFKDLWEWIINLLT